MKAPINGAFLLSFLPFLRECIFGEKKKTMIWYFTPYSLSKNLFSEIDAYMHLIPNHEDWVCLLDGDTMFLYSDFGHKLQEYVNCYPQTGLFTCIANRCHYQCQTLNKTSFQQRDIVCQKNIADRVFSDNGYTVKEVNHRIAGHLMMIKVSTWMKIRAEVETMVKKQEKKILGVDTKISNAILKAGMKIRIMQGFYLFHFLRLDKSIDDDSHLK